MKNAAFTICARNYIGLAQILERSVKRYNPDIDFYIFIADEFTEDEKKIFYSELNEQSNILIAKEVLNISNQTWHEISFKYNLTEFCTAIKASCFLYLFELKGYKKTIFFDPDILLFNDISTIYKQLDTYSIILTPHLLNILSSSSNSPKDKDMMSTGVFNLGFIALKNDMNSRKLLQWWHLRLCDYCYIDYWDGYFTDQKWMDFIPSYFNKGELLISDNLGMNVAPWNFEERKLKKKGTIYYIEDRVEGDNLHPLIFVHYSGFDYLALVAGEIRHTTINGLHIYEDLLPIFRQYEDELKGIFFTRYLKMGYSYNYFDNKSIILPVHRRLYRRFLSDGLIHTNPFSTKGSSFFALLKEHKLISVKSNGGKVNRQNTPNLGRKVGIINFCLKTLYRLIGQEKYFMMTKLFREYGREENHVHIISKKYSHSNIFSERK